MRHRKPFQIFARKIRRSRNRKPLTVFYYRLWSGEQRSTAHSTGQSSRGAAESWLLEQLKNGKLAPRKNPTFKDYTASWWKWDECAYVLGRRARGFRIGRTYVEICRGYLDHHIIPALGNLRLSEITPERIEQLVMDLRKKKSARGVPLSAITVNQVLASLKIIFREGLRLGKIETDPTSTITPLEETPRERSFLTPQEVKKLFNARTIRNVWCGDRRNYTLNLLAASTGMRLGEIQALQVQHVDAGFLRVVHGWTRYGLGEPKRGSRRAIPLPSKTRTRLRELMQISPYQDPEDLVFWGPDCRRPISQTFILDSLYAALEKIGIPKVDREQRNINFHSWRHFFNTFLRGKVPDAKLQALTGHRTIEMTENYTHFRPEDFKDVLQIQEQIL